MQLTLPLEPGKYYHIYHRGNNGENIFIEAINRAYGRTGSLFENRYRRKKVTTDRYFQRLIHYIHWNPQKHGFVTDFRDYAYSSYHLFLTDKPTFVKRVVVLSCLAGVTASSGGIKTMPMKRTCRAYCWTRKNKDLGGFHRLTSTNRLSIRSMNRLR